MATAQPLDSQIRKDVLAELDRDTRVRQRNITVDVQRGIVTLTGAVASWPERSAAREAVHRVRAVHDVVDELEVGAEHGSTEEDVDVAHRVRHALEHDVDAPSENIRSTVSAGIVVLEGTVGYFAERDDIAQAVGRVRGVRSVDNRIAVASPAVGTHALRAVVEQALVRHAAHVAKHVVLAVAGDVVTVSGECGSTAERDAIVGAVKAMHGVRAVDAVDLRVTG